MEFVELLTTYGLLAVLIGVASCILTGIIKIPIKIKINKDKENKKSILMNEYVLADEERKQQIVEELNSLEVNSKNIIRAICTLISAFLSVTGVLLFYIFTVGGWGIFTMPLFYKDIMSAFVVASIIYAIYEKIGAKALVLKLINAVREYRNKKDAIDNTLEIIEKILQEDIRLPLTEEQKIVLTQKYNEIAKK